MLPPLKRYTNAQQIIALLILKYNLALKSSYLLSRKANRKNKVNIKLSKKANQVESFITLPESPI